MKETEARQLKRLRDVLDAKADAQLFKMTKLNQREVTLRSKLAELRGELKRSAATMTPEMKAIGADASLDLWVEHAIAVTNSELTRLLLEKEYMLTNIRMAFGKKVAADEIYRVKVMSKRQ
jgi:hypothetical protein